MSTPGQHWRSRFDAVGRAWPSSMAEGRSDLRRRDYRQTAPRTIPSRDYATISLRGTVQRRRLCHAFHMWFASTRVSWRRSVIGMIGCSAADRGLCALKGGVCTVLTELKAKQVTPFARDEAASFESIFPGRARARRTHRRSEKARRSSSFRLGRDIHTRQPLPTHDETAGRTSLENPYGERRYGHLHAREATTLHPQNLCGNPSHTFSMRLDRFPCMSFVRALAELSTTRSVAATHRFIILDRRHARAGQVQ